jgi:hypothetical protein
MARAASKPLQGEPPSPKLCGTPYFSTDVYQTPAMRDLPANEEYLDLRAAKFRFAVSSVNTSPTTV